MRRMILVAVIAAGAVFVSGCAVGTGSTAGSAQSAAARPGPDQSSAGQPGAGQPGPTGGPAGQTAMSPPASGPPTLPGLPPFVPGTPVPFQLPDVCRDIVTKDVATNYTGKQVQQVNIDHAQPGATTRYCDYQLVDGARLYAALSYTSAEAFKAAVGKGAPIAAVGNEAYWLSGHLFVRRGALQIDLFYIGGVSDMANFDVEKTLALSVLEWVPES